MLKNAQKKIIADRIKWHKNHLRLNNNTKKMKNKAEKLKPDDIRRFFV